MRQLPATGWMHNRARLVVGWFLTKDLHLDWREGEAHFMRYLLDGDWRPTTELAVDRDGRRRPGAVLPAHVNPTLQIERFDPDGEYVRRWVPECGTSEYPEPIVDHAEERRGRSSATAPRGLNATRCSHRALRNRGD